MTEEMNRFLRSRLDADIQNACESIWEAEILLQDVRASSIADDLTETGIQTSSAQIHGWFLAQVFGELIAAWNGR
jgi:hypothetical protein